MIDKFYLSVLTKTDNLKTTSGVVSIMELEDPTFNSMIEKWDRQYRRFTDDIEELDLETTLKAEGHYRIAIHDYDLPNWIEKWSIEEDTIMEMEEDPEIHEKHIKCLIAYMQDQDNEDKEILLFQSFKPSKIIGQEDLISKNREGQYGYIDSTGYIIDRDLAAVYFRKDRKLLIKSYHVASQFLPLDEEYEEATTKEIIGMLSREIFYCPKKHHIAHNCSRSLRRYFSKTKRYGILKKLTISDVPRIVSYGRSMGAIIHTRDEKIYFPEQDEDYTKETLIAVNGDYYRKHGDGAVNEAMTSRPK